jgi:hypothetical protein
MTPDYYLGFKLHENGEYEEIYNGPGHYIFSRFQHRANIGEKLLSFPVNTLRALSTSIPEGERIRRRIN